MTTVVLVCAAGVSGTFLARRISSALPQVRFVVSTQNALPSALAGADAVLVAPQLAAVLEPIRATAAPRPVALLPVDAMTPEGVLIAVDAVEAVIQNLSHPEMQGTTDA